MGELIERMVREVGAFYRAMPEEITRRPLSWLVSVHEQVARYKFEDQVALAQSVELGTLRALVQVMGGKNKGPLPPMPKWEDQVYEEEMEPWMIAFEAANRRKEKPNDGNGR